MPHTRITAVAGANIAFIKYWGNRREGANLPLNPSLSMTLSACTTRTTVEIAPHTDSDEIMLDGRTPDEEVQQRIKAFLDFVRSQAGRRECLRMRSQNGFPTGCGIASSASGFAALALAAATVYDLAPDHAELSRIARMGSGSAARSVMGGFVQLRQADSHEAAFAEQLAPETAWPELRDLIVVVSSGHKEVSSAEGHHLAHTSEMLAGRLEAVPQRIEQVRRALEERDLTALGKAAEADALNMCAVMTTSAPPLLYWLPQTIEVIRCVWELRKSGVEAWFTVDAGPNVHIITTADHLPAVADHIRERHGWRTITDRPGTGAHLEEKEVS
jgi:diphosphomevalonate decarboxylase